MSAATLERIRQRLVGLKMPFALEHLDLLVRQLEAGEAQRPRSNRGAVVRGVADSRKPPHQNGAEHRQADATENPRIV